MARYLQKYVGTYRVLAEYNKDTNDFPRIIGGCYDGQLDPAFDDLYIPCQSKSRVHHVGGNRLQAYIPSIGRGHNIIKAIYNDTIGDSELLNKDYATMYKNLSDKGLIFDIEENDVEILFKFKATNIETIMKYMNPKINGASISPFSTKNLPKSKYDIPEEELALYKEITACISKEEIHIYLNINKGFIEYIASKNNSVDNIKSDMKLKSLKSKEYYHSIGKWKEYLDYIENYLKDIK